MLRNLPLALVVGVLVGLSPHTSGSRWLPSLVGGFLAAVAVLWWRRRRPSQTPVLERPPALVAVAFVGYAVAFAPTAVFLVEDWTDSIWQNGHGILLPLLLGLWAVHLLRNGPRDVAQGTPLGFLLVGLGVGLAAYGAYADVGHLGALGLVISLPGLSLLLLDTSTTRRLTPIWVLALFLVPLPTAAAHWLGLPQSVAAVSEKLLQATGVPAFRAESLLVIPDYRFMISDRCSGVAAFYGGVALAVFLCFHTRSLARRLLLLAAPWVLTVLLSGVRSAVLVFTARYTGLGVIEMATHGLSGIVAFWSVMAGLVLLADRRELRASFT